MSPASKYAEQRASRRFEVSIRIGVRHHGVFLRARSCNISEGGLFICSKNAPAMGTVLKVLLFLGHGRVIETDATVRWVLPPSPGPTAAGFGVQFVAMSAFDSTLLAEFIGKLVAELPDEAEAGVSCCLSQATGDKARMASAENDAHQHTAHAPTTSSGAEE